MLEIVPYSPSLFNFFPSSLRKLGWHDTIKFALMYLHGYEVLVLSRNRKEIGYCVISSGGSIRYPFANKNDKIIQLYFIVKEERGKKLSKILIRRALKDLDSPTNVWAFVQQSNSPSKNILESMGFEVYGKGYYSRLSRRLKISSSGNYCIYLYKKE